MTHELVKNIVPWYKAFKKKLLLVNMMPLDLVESPARAIDDVVLLQTNTIDKKTMYVCWCYLI